MPHCDQHMRPTAITGGTSRAAVRTARPKAHTIPPAPRTRSALSSPTRPALARALLSRARAPPPRRAGVQLLANAKTNNYLINALTAMEAEDAGGTLGIQLDEHRCIVESSIASIAIVSRGVLKTPPFDHALASTTVVRALELARAGMLEGRGAAEDRGGAEVRGEAQSPLLSGVEQVPIPLDEAYGASEMFSLGGACPRSPLSPARMRLPCLHLHPARLRARFHSARPRGSSRAHGHPSLALAEYRRSCASALPPGWQAVVSCPSSLSTNGRSEPVGQGQCSGLFGPRSTRICLMTCTRTTSRLRSIRIRHRDPFKFNWPWLSYSD
jgi:hypothetical protein